jgi:hypothetical protein
VSERSQYQYQPITGPVWREPVAERLAWLPRVQQPARTLPPNKLGDFSQPPFQALYKPENLQWVPKGSHQPQRGLQYSLVREYKLDPLPAPRPPDLVWMPRGQQPARGLPYVSIDRSVYPLQPPAAAAYDPSKLEWIPEGQQPQRGLSYSLVREYKLDPITPFDPATLTWWPEDAYSGKLLSKSRNDWSISPVQPPSVYDPRTLEWDYKAQQPQRNIPYSLSRNYVLEPILAPSPPELSWSPVDDYRGLPLRRVIVDWTLYPLQPPIPYDPQNLEWQSVANYHGIALGRSVNDWTLYPPQDYEPAPPTPPVITGGGVPRRDELLELLQRDSRKSRRKREDEQRLVIEEIAIEHAIDEARNIAVGTRVSGYYTVTLKQIVGDNHYEKMGALARLELEAKIDRIQLRQRIQREDDDFMLMG